MNSTQTNSSKIVLSKIETLLKSKKEKYDKKGVKMVDRAMVLGVPNSGKSTLINNFSGKYKAITGDKPGVTKGKQWVRIGGVFELLDTPGTLWPSFENQEIAKNLEAAGKEEDIEYITLYIGDFFKEYKTVIDTILEKVIETLCVNGEELEDILDWVYITDVKVDTNSWQEVLKVYNENKDE